MGHEAGDAIWTKLHFLKVIEFFFHAHVCGCHITVNHTFFMILDAGETPAQRRFNAPKIIENPSASSEPRADKEHHVEGIFKSGKFISFYRNPCYKKRHFFKKMVAEGLQFRVPSHMSMQS